MIAWLPWVARSKVAMPPRSRRSRRWPSSERIEDVIHFDPVEVVRGNKSIIGSVAYEPQTWKRSLALLARGIVAPEAMITHRLPIEEAEKGFELAAKKEAANVLFIL